MNKHVTKWLFKVPGMKKLYIVFLMLLQAFYGGSGVIYALLLKNVVDSATDGNIKEFKVNVVYIVLLVITQLILRALIRYFNEKARISIENIFRERLFSCILDRDYGKVSAIHSGEWLNRLTSDTEVISSGYVEILPGLVGMLVKLISAVFMLLIMIFMIMIKIKIMMKIKLLKIKIIIKILIK